MEKPEDILFINKQFMLAFLNKGKIAVFSPNLELYPDKSCELMAETFPLIKSIGVDTFTVGKAFYQKENEILFGDEAKKYNEEKMSQYIEKEISFRNSMDYLLENFDGSEC